MNRHRFRWTGLAFGALFLSIAGNWAVWQGDLLTGREMGYVVSGALIAAGLLGVLATFRRPKPPVPATSAGGPAHETDPTEFPTDTDTTPLDRGADDEESTS